ncbi:MAG TPA: hypothetical protein VFF52_25180 [Isosphaeraceae bacterium]|nr:hypothetical protein [Isosphaeraceae bacterium]
MMSQPSGHRAETEESPDSLEESREWINRRATEQATRAANARQLSGRRRFVDPTTCEREYTKAETEFMMAMNEYKRRSGRMFPTWSEVLEVLRDLGYEKVEPESQGGGTVHRQAPARLAAR